jgi:hypothetical protein
MSKRSLKGSRSTAASCGVGCGLSIVYTLLALTLWADNRGRRRLDRELGQ